MKKKVFALLTALLLAVTLIPAAFAADPPTDVEVDANVYAKMSTDTAPWPTNNPGGVTNLVLPQATTNSDVNIKVELLTGSIISAIEAWYNKGMDSIYGLTGGANLDLTDPANANDKALRERLMGYFEQFLVVGTFRVTIAANQNLGIPAKYTDGTLLTMEGFNDEAKVLFKEVSRTYTPANNKLVIDLAIKEPTTLAALYANRQTWLGKLEFVAENVDASMVTGTCTVTGHMESVDDATHDDVKFQITTDTYQSVHFETPTVQANLTRTVYTPGGNISAHKITFNIDGDTTSVAPIYKIGNVKSSELPVPAKTGFVFDGWYTDSQRTNKVADTFRVNKDMTLYGHWIDETLDTEHHYAYVIGYPDETVRPDNNITREEVAMIFYRLLRDEVRASLRTTKNSFDDVNADRWSNTAISTMANGGYITGYPDGTFKPGNNITRAEFATMATRFANLVDQSGASFTDIAGHWAENYVLKAATTGWIAGYPDNTFKPNAYITRAEVMTIINRVLSRSVNKEGLHADTRLWIDMNENDWFYYIVLEATNSHTFTRQADGINETWTSIIANKTWD